MSKNGSRIISFGRYRATDLLLFAAILTVFEVVMFFAYTKWFADDVSRFSFSLVVPITLLVMARWNWYGMFYAVYDGLLYCILLVATSSIESDAILQYFLTFSIGNAFIGIVYLMVHFLGAKRIADKWYFSLLYAVAGWVFIVLGRTVVNLCFGVSLSASLSNLAAGDLLSLAVGILVLLVIRKLDGMLERQKDYLQRIQQERLEKQQADTFGESPLEIDEETLKTLNKKGDDLF